MASSLLALIDDIATLLDDVSRCKQALSLRKWLRFRQRSLRQTA
jgi:hypothetical protein